MPQTQRSHAFGWLMTALLIVLALGVLTLVIGLMTQGAPMLGMVNA